MMIAVLSPGLLTCVQDGGRRGHGAIGVGTAGAMDPITLRLANLLVGNDEDAAALEITLLGPRLRFDEDSLVAICGADIDARYDGVAIPGWRPVLLRAGGELAFAATRRGARAYLAVAGGIDLPRVLGSRCTDLNAALGPLTRALRKDDVVRCAGVAERRDGSLWRGLASTTRTRLATFTRWSLSPSPWFDHMGERPIRAVAGGHFDALDSASQRALFGGEFRVGVDSNRVGMRLEGVPLALREPIEIVSAGTAPGCVQLPPDGTPIALAAEAPTSGGYPLIAHVIAIDQGRLGQRRPGEFVRFAQTDLADAQMRYLERERALRRLSLTIAERLRDADAHGCP
ncbi:MAG: biotin-dependent carboxyltransferase family protein [Rudaea sp.]